MKVHPLIAKYIKGDIPLVINFWLYMPILSVVLVFLAYVFSVHLYGFIYMLPGGGAYVFLLSLLLFALFCLTRWSVLSSALKYTGDIQWKVLAIILIVISFIKITMVFFGFISDLDPRERFSYKYLNNVIFSDDTINQLRSLRDYPDYFEARFNPTYENNTFRIKYNFATTQHEDKAIKSLQDGTLMTTSINYICTNYYSKYFLHTGGSYHFEFFNYTDSKERTDEKHTIVVNEESCGKTLNAAATL